jgi:hypothetical protein
MAEASEVGLSSKGGCCYNDDDDDNDDSLNEAVIDIGRHRKCQRARI